MVRSATLNYTQAAGESGELSFHGRPGADGKTKVTIVRRSVHLYDGVLEHEAGSR